MKIIDLTKLREHSGKTLEDVAEQLEVSKSTILNWEKDAQSLSLDKLSAYAEALGYTLVDLFDQNLNIRKLKIEMSEVKELTEKRALINEFIQKLNLEKTNEEQELLFENRAILNSIIGSIDLIRIAARKPRIAVVGPSDSGKSTLLNTFLEDENIVPARWTPATGLIIKICHINDRPEWVEGNTVIVKNKDIHQSIEVWDLQNRDGIKNAVVEIGNRDIIEKFGDRTGENYDAIQAELLTVFTFFDHELLKNVELWDSPGIGAGSDEKGKRDEALSFYARTNADGVIFLSVANQFLHSDSLNYLRQIIKQNETNPDFLYFIVASQAQIIGSASELNMILENGAERLANQFINDAYSEDELREHMYSFTRDDAALSEVFINDFTEKIHLLSEQINVKLDADLDAFHTNVSENIDREIATLEGNQVDFDQLAMEEKELKQKLSTVLKTNQEIEQEMLQQSKKYRANATYNVKMAYKRIIDEDYLLDLLKKKNIKNKKGSKKEFINIVSSLLQDSLEDELKASAEEFGKASVKISVEKEEELSVSLNNFSFNYQALLGGMIASGLVQGAFIYAVSGIASNLGAYILVAQIGGVLTTMNLISSPIVLTTAVAALGGPVVWAVGISIAAGALVTTVLGASTWKSKFVKMVIKQFEKNNVSELLSKEVNNYWDNTDDEIHKLRTNLDKAIHEKIAMVEQKLNANKKDFELAIKQLVAIKEKIISFR